MGLSKIVKTYGEQLANIQKARLTGKALDERKENEAQKDALEEARKKMDPGSRQEIDTALRIRNQYRNCPTTNRIQEDEQTTDEAAS